MPLLLKLRYIFVSKKACRRHTTPHSCASAIIIDSEKTNDDSANNEIQTTNLTWQQQILEKVKNKL